VNASGGRVFLLIDNILVEIFKNQLVSSFGHPRMNEPEMWMGQLLASCFRSRVLLTMPGSEEDFHQEQSRREEVGMPTWMGYLFSAWYTCQD
jgi:hypothetical protein